MRSLGFCHIRAPTRTQGSGRGLNPRAHEMASLNHNMPVSRVTHLAYRIHTPSRRALKVNCSLPGRSEGHWARISIYHSIVVFLPRLVLSGPWRTHMRGSYHGTGGRERTSYGPGPYSTAISGINIISSPIFQVPSPSLNPPRSMTSAD